MPLAPAWKDTSALWLSYSPVSSVRSFCSAMPSSALVAAFQPPRYGSAVFFDRHFADGEQVIARFSVILLYASTLPFERAHAGDDLLALLRIIPETRLRGLDLQLLYLTLRLLQTERGVRLLKLGLEVVQLDLVFSNSSMKMLLHFQIVQNFSTL